MKTCNIEITNVLFLSLSATAKDRNVRSNLEHNVR